MKRKLVFIVSFISLCITAQSKYTADRYFKEFNYPKAVELYTQIYNKGDKSDLVLSRIADSYYFNVETEKAEKWYKKLLDTHKNVSSEHLFRYAQSLKSNGKYDLSDQIMMRLDEVDKFDSRSDKLELTPNYVELYSKESGDVLSINNVSINTKYSDFGGFGTGDTFYFASASPTKNTKGKLYKWNRQPFLNLYKATSITVDSSLIDLKEKTILSEPIQTHYHEANAIITKSGRTMYFTRDNYDGETTRRSKDRRVKLKLYRATREKGKWANIQELPFNSNEYSVGHPALSPDEKTLYFVSNMPGGYGNTDLYKVDIFAGNKYGNPINLGSKINTEGREMFPYVGADNTLYFSSDGHLGLGALDIFESKIDKENNFGKVTNIKAPFNSKLDDFGFWISEDYKKGFFSSNRKGGKGDDDIYSFTLDRTARPELDKAECTQSISGLVTEVGTNKIMPNTIVKLLDKEGKIINQTTSDKNGMYTFSVSCEQGYKVIATANDYRPDFKAVFTTPETNFNNRADLALKALIVDNQIKLNPIYFDLDKSFIRPDAEYELENIVSVMRNHPQMKIRIESHTDSRASRAYNRKLSDRRAKSTRDFIISRGISSSRIVSAIGFGEDRLLNRCDDANKHKCSEEEHQKNRRSYFYIVK